MSPDSSAVRRSQRRRVPSKRLSEGVLVDLESLLGSEDERDDGKNDGEEDFRNEIEPETEEEVDGVFLSQDSDNIVSSDGSGDGEDLSDSDVRSDLPGTAAKQTKRLGKAPKRVKLAPNTDADALRSRGVIQNGRRYGTANPDSLLSFSNHEDDLIPLRQTRDRWVHDIALPSRLSDRSGQKGGLGLNLFQSEESRNLEATEEWTWYYNHGGQVAFQRLQHTENVDADFAASYMPNGNGNTCNYLMGRLPDQKLHCQVVGAAENLQSAWKTDEESNMTNHTSAPNLRERHGWILNIGEMIQCMDWVPNQPGLTQYLAISTLRNMMNTSSGPDRANNTHQNTPFYKPSQPFPASFQIWEIKGSVVAKGFATMDNNEFPRLRLVMCSDWGDVRQFKWCPLSRVSRPGDDDTETHYLGLLAVLTRDGKVRVLDISLSKNAPTPQYLHIRKSAFEVSPFNTMPASLTWLSSTLLAVGCADGTVAIWDIRDALLPNDEASSPPDQAQANPSPIRRLRLHTTYISALTTMHPSRPSHFLISLSLSGYLRLTDLRSPAFDTVLSARSRALSPTALSWHPATQHVLAADDSGSVRALDARRFYSMIRLAPPHRAEVRCIASSPCHASILVGRSDGSVVAMNPLRRIPVLRRLSWWRQIWFWHEWRRGTEGAARLAGEEEQQEREPEADAMEVDAESLVSPERVPSSGISRFTEGYKPERLSGTATNESSGSSTIYEVQSGIRCLVWNPNVHVGGWAAAGMGSGLVRVEDIAIDT